MALRIDSDLLAKEEAWQLGYGRFKYCGLREDPFGKPPDLQANSLQNKIRTSSWGVSLCLANKAGLLCCCAVSQAPAALARLPLPDVDARELQGWSGASNCGFVQQCMSGQSQASGSYKGAFQTSLRWRFVLTSAPSSDARRNVPRLYHLSCKSGFAA